MSITSAMFTGVSGLLANAENINVIGNNLANVNTIGFKSGRMLFSDMLSVSVGNNSQIGRGTQIQKVDNIFSQSTFQNTEIVTDLAMQGNSFFAMKAPGTTAPLQSQNQAILTRAGSFRTDGSLYLINPDKYQVLDTSGNPIRFSNNAAAIGTAIGGGYQAAVANAATTNAAAAAQYTTPAATTVTAAAAALTAATAALNAANAISPANTLAVTAATAAVTAAQNAVNLGATANSSALLTVSTQSTLASANTTLSTTQNTDTANAAYDAINAASGGLSAANLSLIAMTKALVDAGSTLAAAGTALTNAGAAAAGTAATNAGAAATTASSNNNTTVSNATFVANYNIATGNMAAAVTAYAPVASASGMAFAKVSAIAADGLVTYVGKDGNTYYYNSTNAVGIPTGTATAAQIAACQRIAVINPSNPGELLKMGGTTYQITANAGVPTGGFSVATNSANGSSEKIYSNSLEESNVDMAAQFVKMILTQRAYSANSKTITTADQMTQDVLNLIR